MRRRSSLLRIAAAGGAGYLAGMLPSTDLAQRVAGRPADPARDGTGNPGALNTALVLGRGWGAAVLVADIGKAWAAAALGRRWAGSLGANVAGSAAVIGHCHPVTRALRGGKGVACSAGQVLGTMPVYFPLDALVAAVTARVSGRTDVATLAGGVTWVGVATVLWRRRWNPGGGEPTAALPVAAAVSGLVIGGRFLAEGRPAPEHRYGTGSPVTDGHEPGAGRPLTAEPRPGPGATP